MNGVVLSTNIEMLRVRMVRTAREKGSLVDERVIELSQQLDELLFEIQTKKDGSSQKTFEQSKIIV